MTPSPTTLAPTVLIVDDEPHNLKVLAKIVMDAGWQVRIEVNGKAAIAQCETEAPDLILLDVLLPDINGFAVCQRLKQNPKTQKIPIIFMTALVNAADTIKGFQAGAVDYITKPFQYEVVIARLKVHWQMSQMERQLAQQNQQLQQFNTQLQKQVNVRENQLKISQETLQNFLDNANDLIQSVSLEEGYFLFVNQAWLKTLGYSLSELETLTIFDILHPDYLPHCLPLFEKLQQGKITELNDLELCLISKTGALVYLEGNTKCYPGTDSGIGTWGIFRDVTERRRIDVQLRRSLQEKENLLKEIHHRVKNNLLIVSSLMDWKCELSTDPFCHSLFADSQKRIQAMALIHEKLYSSDNLARINVGEYLMDLAQQLVIAHMSLKSSAPHIELDCQLDPVFVNLETATPCGLIANELILNAIHHAFTDNESGTIALRLKSHNTNEYLLTVEDNGRGMPADFTVEATTTMGWQLIHLLTQQLEADIQIFRDSGTRIELRFTELVYPLRL